MKSGYCPQCGKPFTPRTVTQRYCSAECGAAWRRARGGSPVIEVTFTCANPSCGRVVVTGDRNDGKRDRRSRFCCQECEKAYWRHPPHESTVSHIVETVREMSRREKSE